MDNIHGTLSSIRKASSPENYVIYHLDNKAYARHTT